MAGFINFDEAMKFIREIDDPIAQERVCYMYDLTWDADDLPEGDFDLLYFLRLTEAFIRDRKAFIKALNGEPQKRGWEEE